MDECKPRAARVRGRGNQTSKWGQKIYRDTFLGWPPFVTRVADGSISWDIFTWVIWTAVSWESSSGEKTGGQLILECPGFLTCPGVLSEGAKPPASPRCLAPTPRQLLGKCVPQWVQTCQFQGHEGILCGPQPPWSALRSRKHPGAGCGVRGQVSTWRQ